MRDPFDDSRLAAALRSGQPAELRAAFDRHADAMLLLIRSLTKGGQEGGQEEASRLLQRLWVTITPEFARSAVSGSARAWLFSRLLDTFGPVPEGSAEPPEPDFLPDGDPWEGHWVDFPVPWRPEPADLARSPQARAVIEAAIIALPLDERVILILRDMDGWTSSEIVALTGLMPDDARTVLHTARLKIRDALDPLLREEVSSHGDR